jgi:hypothetical protein
MQGVVMPSIGNVRSIKYSRLRELIDYNPDTGVFLWKLKPSNRCSKRAGSVTQNGYRSIRVDNKAYLEHRLAWLYFYGYMPENYIDHINRDKTDNRIDNLREVSMMCNLRNCSAPKNNTSGVTGVSWRKDTKKWSASMMVNRKGVSLGCYNDFDNAVLARLTGEFYCGWHDCNNYTDAMLYAVNKSLYRSITRE